ncbi:MAG: DnaD domain protein [Clostridia bacterium]|nr:DnaD domain protein [Clostridia bacterium]
MKISIKYGGKILNLPAKVAELTPKASYEDLAVIINLFSYSEYFDSFDEIIEVFSNKIGVSVNDVLKSLAFWCKEGVIDTEELKNYTPVISVSNRVPSYSGAQISRFIEGNKKIASLFDACQQIMGKAFTPVDYNNLIFLKEYFKLPDDYIMLLIAHCVENEKDGWAYIRKTARNLYEDGVDTYPKLEKHFEARKNKATLEYKIRSIFEIGSRELSKKEKEKIDIWIGAEVSEELIRKAYETTVNNTGKISIAYASKIIENWISLGFKTVEDVESVEKSRKSKLSLSTFDANEFFEAALERSEELYKSVRKEAKK